MTPHNSERADLHLHSRASDRPSEWFLRRIGAPESFLAPAEAYRRCRERGMDFVTLTDHNTLDGVLEIADRPGVFLSVEATSYFPEDGAKLHVLIWGLSEAQFATVQSLRPSVYELCAWLRRERLPHAVAHPLFRVDGRLTADHVERLLVLFDTFEGVNGSRDPRAGVVFQAILAALTTEDLARFAERHRIANPLLAPERKRCTGGSDDHSGLYLAEAWTTTPPAVTVAEFLDHLRAGRHEPGGRAGSSLRLTHSVLHIAAEFLRAKFPALAGERSLLGAVLARVGGVERPAPGPNRLRRAVAAVVRRVRHRRLPPAERQFAEELFALAETPPPDAGVEDSDPETIAFRRATRVAHRLALVFAERFFERLRAGRILDAIEAGASLGPLALAAAPYLTAVAAQHKDEAFLQSLADRIPGAAAHRRRSRYTAWLTDTLTDLNGVARTVRSLAALAHREGREVVVVTCQREVPAADYPLKVFEPMGEFTLPEYPQQPLRIPPVLDVIEFLERERVDHVLISTPGPVGLCGLWAARLLALRQTGIYHTDFPDYIRLWTDDELMRDLAVRYMRWFYSGLDRVYVPSRATLEQLVAMGLDPQRLTLMPRGIDLDQFSPSRRNPDLWKRYGVNGGTKFLYVGRIAREKNLELLVEAYRRLARSRRDVALVLVGDGPELEPMRRRYANEPGIVWTGALYGEELACAYASADVFVFPSLTDTFGNAVIEAHASGLPAIVAGRGGPPEIVRSHGSGIIVERDDPDAWSEAMKCLLDDLAWRDRLREAALARAREGDWRRALVLFD
ncbi:MAG: glycosyltransferase [Kiritimatiellae bacterium]|nr:glycosyltransferase [Kiritimatiellia bacterium]